MSEQISAAAAAVRKNMSFSSISLAWGDPTSSAIGSTSRLNSARAQQWLIFSSKSAKSWQHSLVLSLVSKSREFLLSSLLLRESLYPLSLSHTAVNLMYFSLAPRLDGASGL